MRQHSPKNRWQRFRSYIAELSIANKGAAFLTAVGVVLQVLILLGYFQDMNIPTMAIMNFALLALLAVVVDSQVHQKRAFEASERFHRETELSMSSNKASLDGLLAHQAPFDVRPDVIKPELDRLLDPKNVRVWKFRGGSGRWQRSAVLPALAEVKTADVDYKMLILDPRSKTLCGQYARYRNTHRLLPETARQVRMGTISRDTERSVAEELLACIVAAAWFTAKSRVKAKVYLSQTYSPLRMDLGTNGAMLTVSDPTKPGLMCRPDSWLYSALEDEFDRNIEQSPEIHFGHVEAEVHQLETLDGAAVAQILQSCRVIVSNSSTLLMPQDELEKLDTEHLASLALANPTERS